MQKLSTSIDKSKKKYFSKIKKDFRSNKIYDWNQNRENLDKRSNKNYFFLKKIFKFTKLKKSEKNLRLWIWIWPTITYFKKKKIKAIGLEPSSSNSAFSKKSGHNVINGYLNNKTFKKKVLRLLFLCILLLTSMI